MIGDIKLHHKVYIDDDRYTLIDWKSPIPRSALNIRLTGRWRIDKYRNTNKSNLVLEIEYEAPTITGFVTGLLRREMVTTTEWLVEYCFIDKVYWIEDVIEGEINEC